MFVKVAGNPTHLFDAGDEVMWGDHIIQDGRTELGDIDWLTELDISFESLAVLGTSGPDGENDGRPFWIFRWASWIKPGLGGGRHGVVSNSRIFIVGEDGKTIDRV